MMKETHYFCNKIFQFFSISELQNLISIPLVFSLLFACEHPSGSDSFNKNNFITELTPAQKSSVSDLSFYSFRTVVDPDVIRMLQDIQPRELVFRLFDVDLDRKTGKPVPVTPLRINKKAAGFLKTMQHTEISGLVFVTNRTLLNIESEEIPILSENIVEKVNIMQKVAGLQIRDLQMDCDWNMASRNKYFTLLKLIRSRLSEKKISLSVTIRLHQIKFREITGIPPADRGILMFYNMDDPGKWETKNSILNLNTARSYMERLGEYPIALDIALPLYSQTAVFSGGRITGLIGGDLIGQLSDEGCFEEISENRFRSIKRCMLDNHCGTVKDVSAGSILRYENTDPRELMDSLREILKKRDDIKRLYVYDLNQSLFVEQRVNDLDRIMNTEQDRVRKQSDYDRNHSAIFFNGKNVETLVELSKVFRAHRSKSTPSGQ